MNQAVLVTNPNSLPSRFERPGILSLFLTLLAVWFVAYSFQGAGISLSELASGFPEMISLLGQMLPPDTTRLPRIGWSLLETFQMALVGTVIGIIVSFPLAALASRATSPHPIVYQLARGIVSLFRTVPDLVWALFFVATVGLGPFAGTLTLAVDTIGFCGRFFAEGMEEVEKGPKEALTALGATRTGIFFSFIVPASLPSFITSSLFSLEKAVRSSVVLGLVGAGGIGIELKVAMDMFRYAEASMIILCIFALVILVERVSSRARKKLLD
ncbi:MAG: phosphonate ABC transporter, permease protein PhnE [Bdellovibrionales bacterium]|nr:phosphonate ABC transporter, permease protein PhnE [Bdellovibrionales bacterium]